MDAIISSQRACHFCRADWVTSLRGLYWALPQIAFDELIGSELIVSRRHSHLSVAWFQQLYIPQFCHLLSRIV